MPKIVVVPHSAIVVRRPEKADFQHSSLCPASLRSKLDKRGLIFSRTTENASKQSNVSIDLARKYLRRSHDDHADTYDSKGGIFPVHAENERRELRRRNTESNLRRRAELDISRPIKSPPAPDGTMLKKHGERQVQWTEWNKRPMNTKREQNVPIQPKRWSLKTWKIQSGRASIDIPQHYKAHASTKNRPKSVAKRAISFYSQRWSLRPTTEKLNVTRERQAKRTPPIPQHNHSYNPSPIPNKSTSALSVPKKAASTGMMRPQVSFSDRLPVPDRYATQHPAFDQRHIHPAFRTPPTTYNSSLHTHLEVTRSPSPEPILRVPRVRIIPPSTLLESHNQTVTNTSHSILPIKPPTPQDQQALVKSLNTMRAAVSTAPLDLHPFFSLRAMDYVRNNLPPLPPPKSRPLLGHERRESAARNYARNRSTKVEHIPFKAPRGASAMRLISPPALGALACVELWASGKYKRHKTVQRGLNPAYHRFTRLPDFEMNGEESVGTLESEGGGKRPCGCLEHDAYSIVTGGRWVYVGVGRAADGRWVVELWEPDVEAEVVERGR